MEINHLVIAGWTGRDEAALQKHVKELEEIGRASCRERVLCVV